MPDYKQPFDVDNNSLDQNETPVSIKGNDTYAPEVLRPDKGSADDYMEREVSFSSPESIDYVDSLSMQRGNAFFSRDIGATRRNSRGVFGELISGVGAGSFHIVEGAANTFEEISRIFGTEIVNSVSDRMKQYERFNQGGYLSHAKDMGIVDWSARMIGEQLPIIISSYAGASAGGSLATLAKLGAGATKAAVTVGQMASMSAWLYGDRVDAIRQASNGRLSDGAEFGLAAISTLGESILEQMLGPEKLIGRGATLNAIAKSGITEKMAQIAGTRALGFTAKNYFGGIAMESMTEVAQSLAESMWTEIAAGDGIGFGKEEFVQAFSEGIMAIPSAAFFGGYAAFTDYQARKGYIKRYQDMKGAQEMIAAAHGSEAITLLDEGLLKVRSELAQNMGEESAGAVTEIMRTASLNWAVKTGNNPISYINDFKMFFTDTVLTPAQISKIRSITDVNERMQWMRKNVNGFRYMEDGVEERFRTDGIQRQFQVELESGQRMFGATFGEDLVPKENGRTESEQTDAYREGVGMAGENFNEVQDAIGKRVESGEITEAQAADILSGYQDATTEAGKGKEQESPEGIRSAINKERTEWLNRLYAIRQRAVEEAHDLFPVEKGKGWRVAKRRVSLKSASDMFVSLYDRNDSSWIDESTMRNVLVDVIQENHPGVSHAKAIEIVESLDGKEKRGTGYTHLQAAFLDEMSRRPELESEYSSDDIRIAGDDVAKLNEQWKWLQEQDLSEDLRERLLDIKERLGQLEQQQREEDARRAEAARNIQEDRRRFNQQSAEEDLQRELDLIDQVLELEAKLTRDFVEQNRAEADAIDMQIDALKAELSALETSSNMFPQAVNPRSLAAERKRMTRKIEKLRMKWKEAIDRNAGLPVDFLESGNEEIYAHYDTDKRVAIFYGNATAEDVIHEWFHHVDISGLLPSDVREKLDAEYGIHKGSTERDIWIARERAAHDFMESIRNRIESGTDESVTEQQRLAFDYLKKVFRGSFDFVSGTTKFNGTSREYLESALDSVPDDAQAIIGTMLAKDVHYNLPGKSRDAMLLESSSFANETDDSVGGKLWNAAMLNGLEFRRAAVASILGKEDSRKEDWVSLSLPQKQQVARMSADAKNVSSQSGLLPHGIVNEIAQNMYGKDFNELGYTPEGTSQKKGIIGISKRMVASGLRREMARLAKAKNRDDAVAMHVDRLIGYLTAHPGTSGLSVKAMSDEPCLAPRAKYIAAQIGNVRKGFNSYIRSNFDDAYTYIRYLDDGNPNGIFGQIFGQFFHDIARAGAEADTESAELFKAAERKFGAFPRPFDYGRKHGFGDSNTEFTTSDAIGIYLVTNRGKNKAGEDTLIKSNPDKFNKAGIDSIVRDVIDFVEGRDNKHGVKGFVAYIRNKEGNDFEFVRKEEKGASRSDLVKTAPAMNLVKAWREISPQLHAMMDKVYFDQTGTHLPFRKDYFPFIRINGLAAQGDMMADLFAVNEFERRRLTKELYADKYGEDVTFDKLSDFEKQNVMKGEVGHSGAGLFSQQNGLGDPNFMQKERTDASGGSPIMLDAVAVIERYRIQADIYRSKANTLSVLNAILSNDSFKDKLVRRFGESEGQTVLRTLTAFANREKFPYGRTEPIITQIDMNLKKIRSAAVLSQLSLKIPSMVRQTISGLNALGEIDPKYIPRYFGNFWSMVAHANRNPSRILDSIAGRHNPFTQEGPGKEVWDLILKYSPEITKRYADPDMQDITSSAYKTGLIGGIPAGKANVAQWLMGGFRMMDLITVTSVYGTAFQSKYDQLTREGDVDAERKAAAFAADVVSKTQPASGVTDRNLTQTGSEYKRALFMYTGQLMKNFQYYRTDIIDPLVRGWRNGKLEGNGLKGIFDVFTKGEYGQRPVMQKAFFSVVIPAIALGMTARRRLPEDEDEVLQDLFGYTIASLPLIGPIFSYATLNDWRSQDGSIVYVQATQSMAKALHDVTHKDVSLQTAKDALRGAATATGFPSAFLTAGFEVLEPKLNSDYNFSVLKMMGLSVAEKKEEQD